MKEEHSLRVCDEIINIGRSIGVDKQHINLAYIIALFHDIGRFEQYRKYGTFSDKRSENHAILGVKILNEGKVLDIYDDYTKSLILRVIGYHNNVYLPTDETDDCLLFTKMLRDADKIDIWRVVTNYYLQIENRGNKSIELDLPDIPEVSEKILSDLLSGKIIRSEDMNTLNDFKVLQMAWVYDLNFQYSFKEVLKRKYIEKIKDSITDKKRAIEVYSVIKDFLKKKTN